MQMSATGRSIASAPTPAVAPLPTLLHFNLWSPRTESRPYGGTPQIPGSIHPGQLVASSNRTLFALVLDTVE
jgi:hypothetical protein